MIGRKATGAAGLMFAPPAVLIRTGECLVPADLSWRRAQQIIARGFGTLDPHHKRWLGKLRLTEFGRIRLGCEAVAPVSPGDAPGPSDTVGASR